jgi:hypothetical protein
VRDEHRASQPSAAGAAVAAVNSSSDSKAVTITIGLNDVFRDPNHLHPNDAGHLAIAKAFGGAATPTAPPPSAPTLGASKPKLSSAIAGKPFTAWMLVTDANSGKGVNGRVTCQGRLAGEPLRAKRHSSLSNGRSSCPWQMPAAAHNTQFIGSITLRFQGSGVSRSFTTKVK